MAEAYCNKVKPYFEVIREHCDKLELLVDNGIWPLTKYRELFLLNNLFINSLKAYQKW